MSGVRIDSLHLELNGVSPEVARAALDGLDAELRRRLAVDALELRAAPSAASRLAPLEVPPRIDAVRLRALLADRLIELLASAAPGVSADTEAL